MSSQANREQSRHTTYDRDERLRQSQSSVENFGAGTTKLQETKDKGAVSLGFWPFLTLSSREVSSLGALFIIVDFIREWLPVILRFLLRWGSTSGLFFTNNELTSQILLSYLNEDGRAW